MSHYEYADAEDKRLIVEPTRTGVRFIPGPTGVDVPHHQIEAVIAGIRDAACQATVREAAPGP
ncbi:hypothetical protein [Streptomyces sp. ISL-86]|uniref:hypothetical protein n=1 Tax=Streptomyces sp. ISL-86 TaxID=2819187 RepID=UPI001BE9A7A0|nr:hypothetical protein [Streptomyces sp. ISL-86]MBT2455587.1 hypothetical protein [Streptomyces sp. ISL-86]